MRLRRNIGVLRGLRDCWTKACAARKIGEEHAEATARLFDNGHIELLHDSPQLHATLPFDASHRSKRNVLYRMCNSDRAAPLLMPEMMMAACDAHELPSCRL